MAGGWVSIQVIQEVQETGGQEHRQGASGVIRQRQPEPVILASSGLLIFRTNTASHKSLKC